MTGFFPIYLTIYYNQRGLWSNFIPHFTGLVIIFIIHTGIVVNPY